MHFIKKKKFVKTHNVNVVFLIFRNGRKYIFRKSKIKESIMFSTISDIFSNNLIDQDNDSDKTIRKGLNTVPREWEI